MNEIRKRNKAIGWFLFLIYLFFLVYFLFFSEAMGRTGAASHGYNLELFREIKRFYVYREQLGIKAVMLNIVGNVLAFIPFGFFRPVIGRRRHNFFRTVFSGFIFSLAVELTQLVIRVGSFDVDDIFLNTLGCILGYILFVLTYTWIKRRR